MLPADLLSRCAEFCQDAAFCALQGSSGQWFAATTPAKTARSWRRAADEDGSVFGSH